MSEDFRRAFTHVALAACVIAFGACDKPAANAPVTVRFVEDSASPRYGGVEAFPVPGARLRTGEWSEVLFVRGADTTGLPMFGTYAMVGDTLRFQPRFAPLAGATYHAWFNDGVLKSRADWQVPKDSGPSTTSVAAVYPSADAVPMNLLRMYVEFSAPMTTGKVWDYVKLYSGDSLVHEPFYTAGGVVELWDPEKRRLTVPFDPGRIKRDLKPNEELGLPLRTGKSYRLVIDSAWPDAAGRPLRRPFVKSFRVVGMDRALVRTAGWRLTRASGERGPLTIDFPESLDRALLMRMLVVRNSAGRAVVGTVKVTNRETRWTFTPWSVWRRGSYYIDIDTELEDLAGNNLKRLFDVAPGDKAATGLTTPRTRLPFQVR